jgi:hypothetical protein
MNELSRDRWAPTIAATVGTSAGATLAFWSERRNRSSQTENERVTANSNCSTEFIARHDADDIACPERFPAQLACFDAQPEGVTGRIQ